MTNSPDADRSTAYLVYDRRSGQIFAAHRVTALAGARMPSDDVVQKKVLGCAAEAFERSPGDLAVLEIADLAALVPGAYVDVETKRVRVSEYSASRDVILPQRQLSA